MLAVICPAYLDNAVRVLWPEAKTFRMGSGLTGHRFDRIIMLQNARSASQGSQTAEAFIMDRWLEDELLLKLKPGGDILWLT